MKPYANNLISTQNVPRRFQVLEKRSSIFTQRWFENHFAMVILAQVIKLYYNLGDGMHCHSQNAFRHHCHWLGIHVQVRDNAVEEG